jgi:hypothetical protein
MIRKEFSYITMLTKWVSRYAPYITTLPPTTGFNVRQHPKFPLALLFHPKGAITSARQSGELKPTLEKRGERSGGGELARGRDFVSYCCSGIFVMPVRLKQPEISA